ncbi:MAG TPA: hypothetical protein VFO33_01015 [Casimicrobiaceae bacterium]|nr:hypothetical protein [Casimicrobiaceae bacterium]
MKATNYWMEDDDRGIFALMIHVFSAALAPSAREAWDSPAVPATPKLGWFERFDRWAATLRQRDRERFLADSKDVFELERRLKALERRPYF